MASGPLRFGDFQLHPDDRRLTRDGATVELNARYFDALALLVREHGRLVTKDRFLDEVWRGVPVTDEALTQCIRTLRRTLGDSAGAPRFIETAPRHGYRFIAPVETPSEASAPAGGPAKTTPVATPSPWRRFLLLGLAGAVGGGVAGAYGGLFYGFVAAAGPEAGGVSVLLVLVCLTLLVGVLGGGAVGLGVAAAGFTRTRQALWSVVGGAAGGMLVGGIVHLVGLDAFDLLFGRAPGGMTGAPEGFVLGGAVALGLVLGRASLRRAALTTGLTGGVAGVLIPLSGGRLMGGSLQMLAGRFPESRLGLDRIGDLFGEVGFGPVSQAVIGGIEGLLFGAGVAVAMVVARRRLAG